MNLCKKLELLPPKIKETQKRTKEIIKARVPKNINESEENTAREL